MQKNAVNVLDKLYYDVLGTELEDSDIIDTKMKEAYEIIRKKNIVADTAAPVKKNTVWKKVFITLGSMAAVLCLTFIFCVMNPVMAREIPILGNIFMRIADVYQFGKLPEESTVELSSEESAAGLFSEEGLVYTDGGITISITEEYVSNQAVYIGVKVENVQVFPEMVATIEDGQQFIKARTLEDYSFAPGERRSRRYIEGRFVDEHTFLGAVRIDYDDIRRYMEESGIDTDIPETFTIELEIVEIASTLKDPEIPKEFKISDEEYEQMTEEQQVEYLDSIPKAWYGIEYESWHQEGTWHLTIPISQTDENSRIIEVEQYESDGIGVESIELSSMEMSVTTVIPENISLYTAVFDADGKEIEYKNGSNAGSALLIEGHDISTVSVYMCDLSEYFELAEEHDKGISQEIVEGIAQFKVVVRLEE
ncbi:MAG: DUF4179 domain-containing protein [Lachnospiraceae bacterium]|nr:DUF4179 domain-containing protein [Lachnospiraceae bacterium]